MTTSDKNTNSISSKKNIRFEHDLIKEIESVKGALTPFSAWVKAACREKLHRDKMGVRTSAPVLDEPVRPGVDMGAHLEQENTPITKLQAGGRVRKQKIRARWHTPDGVFGTCQQAADAIGRKRRTLSDWFKDPEMTDYWKEDID